jgi:arylsulfatase A-like enzyme
MNGSWVVVAFASALCFCTTALGGEKAPPPNIVVILADDLGFSDLGCYGGEIATPNLDALAAGGLRYTQFYNTARCWPTRAALLTGYYPQQVGFDALPNAPRANRRQRPSWARLLPDYLRPLGYRSYHSGKWHLDGGQIEGGFDRSYSLDDHDRYFSPRKHTLDDRRLPPVERNRGYYATTAIAQHAIDFLKEHAENHAGEPFFQYVAFISPHFPLHGLPQDIARYADRYRLGWDATRQERWQRITSMLRLPGDLAPLEPEIGPPYKYAGVDKKLGPEEVFHELSWDALTSEQQAFQAAKMAVHAAMVDRMDREIGRLIEQLREMGALDNTVIFFLSDNGASAEIMVRGDGHDSSAPAGSADTFLCLGPGWSSAANTPFRRHKSWVHEGGIATPLVVHWPAGISGKGELRHAVGHVIDLAPTIRQLAGGALGTGDDKTEPPPAPGRDMSPTFDRDVNVERDFLWWLHNGNRAIRVEDWKLVADRDGPWELYDLQRDRAENHDMASDEPERVQELKQLWQSTTRSFQRLASSFGEPPTNADER